jgi:hypothetical protein
MRWFRSNMRLGSWCGLFALAIQLAVSFSHVHLDGFGNRLAGGFSARLATQTPSVLPNTAQPLPKQPDAPSSPPIGGDLCPICTLIHLAGSLLPATPPSLPTPVLVSPIRLTISVDREHGPAHPRLFQARAPPIA